MAQDLRGKWVLLTGAASGIGRETCLILAREGCNLILADIDEEGLKSLAQQLESLGAKVISKVTDITNGDDIQALIDEVREKVGAVDVLVNNAGIGLSEELMNTTEDQWNKLLNINFMGAVNMVNTFLPDMIKNGGGQIVNMSTGQVFYPVPTWGAYAASKAALATYSECLTWELRRFGIRVTTVFPGLISTPFYDEVKAETTGQKLVLWYITTLGSTPGKMAMKIVNGIKRRKRRVIQSWINWMNYLLRRPSPHLFEVAGDMFAKALGERS